MADKTRFAFGDSSRVQESIDSGKLDEYDILLLDGETDPKIGWVDANGVFRLVKNGGSTGESVKEIVRVSELPTENGDENVVYIFNNEGYIWNPDENKCVSMSKSSDLTALETQVSTIETQIGNKVDAETVQIMIEEHADSAFGIIEF